MTTITRADFIATIRAALSDGSTFFSAADLQELLGQAIRAYSQHFPRIQTIEITTVAAQHQYTVSQDEIRDIINVQYPANVDTAQTTHLRRGDHSDPDFWNHDDLYDYLEIHDSTINDQIIISASPAADEPIWIKYTTNHAVPSSDASALTPPLEHHPLILAHCVWQALVALTNNEQMSPTNTSALLASQFGENANRARAAYNDALAQALAARSHSRHTRWQMDKWDT